MSPTDFSRRDWWGVLKRTAREFQDDNLTDWAAALTYYSVLSLFPALLLLISILGLVGQSATEPLIENIEQVAPSAVDDIAGGAIENVQKSQGAAGVLLVVSLLAAFWAASSYLGAFIRAANIVWDVEEGRPIWKTVPLRLSLTLAMLILLSATAIAVVVTGPVAEWVGNLVGLGDLAITIWGIAKWPFLLVLVAFMFALLYWAAPNVKQSFPWITPGGVLAVLIWILVSLGFGFYVANFSSYNKTYGSLGGIVIFLIWLWLSNIAILLGAEFNAELERQRQIEEGHPEDKEPFLPLRDEPD